MNREIKFRAWDGKKMYLPEYSDPSDFHIFADGTIVETHEYGYERHELTSRRSENWILMQYTGLKDKNGVEIYEGDIYESLKIKCIVVFYEGAFCGHRIGKKPEPSMPIGWSSDEYGELSPDNFSSKIEVIGNIYQNPELLK